MNINSQKQGPEESSDNNSDALLKNNLKEVYQQLCDSYRAIDDFRSKLLGFLPLATGTGIFLLLNKLPSIDNLTDQNKEIIFTIGVFGCLITFGLFLYEIYGIKKCGALIFTGQCIEFLLNRQTGQFLTRPRKAKGWINEPAASGFIYPAVMAGWIYFGLYGSWPRANPWIPVAIFVFGFAFTIRYERQLERKLESQILIDLSERKTKMSEILSTDAANNKMPGKRGNCESTTHITKSICDA